MSGGLGWALLGTVGFSGSAPATRAVVLACGPFAAAFGRIVVATVAAALVLLLVDRTTIPTRRQWLRLAVVTGGVVLAFPVLTALALGRVPATHMALMVGVLPMLMALLGQWRSRERPSGAFWLASAAGFVAIASFALTHGRSSGGGLAAADALLLAAAVAAAFGYGEGGLLARQLGGWRVICWALVLAAPVTLGAALLFRDSVHAAVACTQARGSATFGIAYLGLVSMLFAFFAWYHGLSRGGIAKASQVQLAQLPLSLIWSAWWLRERIDLSQLVTAAVVIASLIVIVKTRVARAAPLAGGPT